MKRGTTDDEAPYYLGLLAAAAGRHQAARQHFALSVSNAQGLAEEESKLGERNAKHDQQSGAVARFRAALRYRPDFMAAYKWMARALRRWGRLDELADLLQEMSRQDQSAADSFRVEFKADASLSERLGRILFAHRSQLSGQDPPPARRADPKR